MREPTDGVKVTDAQLDGQSKARQPTELWPSHRGRHADPAGDQGSSAAADQQEEPPQQARSSRIICEQPVGRNRTLTGRRVGSPTALAQPCGARPQGERGCGLRRPRASTSASRGLPPSPSGLIQPGRHSERRRPRPISAQSRLDSLLSAAFFEASRRTSTYSPFVAASTNPPSTLPLLVRDVDQPVRLIGDLVRGVEGPDLVGDCDLERVEDSGPSRRGRPASVAADLLLPRAEVRAHRIELRDVLLSAELVTTTATCRHACDDAAERQSEQHPLRQHTVVLDHPAPRQRRVPAVLHRRVRPQIRRRRRAPLHRETQAPAGSG